MSCITPATGQATAMYYVVQETCGEVPANPVWKRLRFTGGVPAVTRDTLESAELNGTSELTSIRLGSYNVAGDAAVELYPVDHDDLLACALQSTWTAGSTVAGLTVDVDADAKTFTRAAGSFITDGVTVGSLIRFPGLTGANSQPLVVTAVSALVVTAAFAPVAVAELGRAGLADQTAGSTSLVIGSNIKVGVARKKIAILTVYNDITPGTPVYDLAIDAEITGFNFSVGVNSIVTGTFNMIGRYFGNNVALPTGSTFAPDSTKEPFSGFEGGVIYDQSALGFVSSLEITLDRGAQASFVVGDKFASHITYTKARSTLTANTFLYDGNPLKSAFFSEAEKQVVLVCNDGTNATMFRYPRVTITSAAPQVQEGDIQINAEMQASRDTTLATSLQIWSI